MKRKALLIVFLALLFVACDQNEPVQNVTPEVAAPAEQNSTWHRPGQGR